MDLLLVGDDPVLKVLSEQLQRADVVKREFTGAGFFMTFDISADAPRILGNKSFSFGDVIATIDGLQRGAGFVLHVKDGILDYLEGYTFDEPWPDHESTYQLSYISGAERNLAESRKEWT